MKTKWLIKEETENPDIAKIADQLQVPEKIIRILFNRGISNIDTIKNFLNPNINNLYNPFLMKGMDKAIERVHRALENNEKIMIFGDYDADGITSTSLLYMFLEKLGNTALYYIPNRIDDGYGLSIRGIEYAIKKHVDLIITVDCGITAINEVEYAKKNGVDVIITDHHEVTEKLPDADAIINPHRNDDNYPFEFLAGCGVVLKFIQAYSLKYLNSDNEINNYIDIVALGTIADVVPLIDENRIITYYGLQKLTNTENEGIKALCKVADLKTKNMTSFHIGFVLAPRINAIGRMSDAREAVKLFITNSEYEAYNIAHKLNYENRKRQKIDQDVYEEALEIIENEKLYENKTIVIANENWHEGVIGIVASRIAEKYYKPTIMISLYDDIGKGSGRSIPQFHLYDSLKEIEDLLESFGGHKLAAGITIRKNNLEEFKKKFEAIAQKSIKEDTVKNIEIDSEIHFNEITDDLEESIKLLAPFGYGNPKPVFLTKSISIVGYPVLFKDRHLKFVARNNDKIFDAIWFNNGKEFIADMIKPNAKIDIVYYITRNNYQGRNSIQLQIIDMHINNENRDN